ncbi:MAG TPA: PAS domain-containing sensor histidine kinase [Gemmatimonadaceae bacterium]
MSAATAVREVRESATDRDNSVAILTPTGRDGPLAKQVLGMANVEANVCRDMQGLARAVRAGVGAVIVAEEALTPAARLTLTHALDGQPSWSDIAVIVLTSEGELSLGVSPAVNAMAGRGSVTLLERPVRVATLITVLTSALRARQRQYDLRDYLAERLAAEQSLRESEARLRGAVQAAPYPMMLYTGDGQVLQLSRAWTEITGYSAAELTSVVKWAALGGDGEAAAHPSLGDALKLLSSGDRTVRTREGYTRVWNFHAVSLGQLPDGRALWLTAAMDVTEFRTLLNKERASRASAENANRAKSDFLAVMSHELRTPLNAIAGYCDILEIGVYGPVTNKQHEAINRIKQSEVRLLSLINDVLNLAKIESGRLQVDIASVDIAAVARSVEGLIGPQTLKKQLTYTSVFPPAPAMAVADGEKAGQVILNLLSNAVKFTPEHGRVHLEVARRGDDIVTSISDTGPGIAAEKREIIFEPFVQVGRSRSSTAEGTGLGLAISRDLARLMKGDITVENNRGDGATFTFCLPASIAPPYVPQPVEP